MLSILWKIPYYLFNAFWQKNTFKRKRCRTFSFRLQLYLLCFCSLPISFTIHFNLRFQIIWVETTLPALQFASVCRLDAGSAQQNESGYGPASASTWFGPRHSPALSMLANNVILYYFYDYYHGLVGIILRLGGSIITFRIAVFLECVGQNIHFIHGVCPIA